MGTPSVGLCHGSSLRGMCGMGNGTGMGIIAAAADVVAAAAVASAAADVVAAAAAAMLGVGLI